jgi:LysM repeat protein
MREGNDRRHAPALAGPRRAAWSPLPLGGGLQGEGREGKAAEPSERWNGRKPFGREEIFLLRRSIATSFAWSIAGALLASSTSLAAVPHTVLPGETLWSISAANNLTTPTVADYNGLPEDALLVAGTTVYVPTVQEGAAALATGAPAVAPVPSAGSSAFAGSPPSEDSTISMTTVTPAPGMDHVSSPYGELHLVPAAADAWNAMRAEAQSAYGIDLYPGGPLSAYRTYEQQAELYEAFLEGYGAPASLPGTSSHELGTAVDVETPEMSSVIDQLGWKYGWSKVHGLNEWWHVEYGGG